MPLTPLDIESRSFKREFGGYRRSEVDAFLRSSADALSHAVLERDDLGRQLLAAREEVDGFRQRERTLMEALSSAERLAEERKAMAETEAERIVADARRHAEQMVMRTRGEVTRIEQQILRLKVERETFENRLRGLLDEHRRLLEVRKQEVGVAEKLRSRSTLPPPSSSAGPETL